MALRSVPKPHATLLLPLLFVMPRTVACQSNASTTGERRSITELKVAEQNVLRIPAFSSIGYPVCDAAGNAYFTVAGIGKQVSTVLRVSADASDVTPFRLPENLLQGSGAWHTTVTPGGTVYAFYVGNDLATLTRFTRDGEPDQQTKIQLPDLVRVSSLAVFNDGRISVIGTRLVAGPKKEPVDIFYRGQFRPDGRPLLIDNSAAEQVDTTHLLNATIALDSLDNAYFIRKEKIIALRSSGEISRTLRLSEVPEDSTADGAQAIGGRLAISYSKRQAKTAALFNQWDVVDPNSGELLGRYAPGPDFRGSRLCYLGKQGFTYITRINGQVSIVRMPLP